jgi:hypothetical protein
MWKEIECTDYEVSATGVIRNMDTKEVKNYVINAGGYARISLHNAKASVHRIVAGVFIPNPDKLPVVNHKDGNKLNNSVDNLEWVTHSDNTQHAYDTGLKARGEDFNCAKLSNEDVEEIKHRFVAGDRSVDIARDYGVVEGSIANIRSGRAWAHIRPDLQWQTKERQKSTRKLTATDIPVIRQRFKEGDSDTSIAATYGVNRGTIFQIRSGKNWANY